MSVEKARAVLEPLVARVERGGSSPSSEEWMGAYNQLRDIPTSDVLAAVDGLVAEIEAGRRRLDARLWVEPLRRFGELCLQFSKSPAAPTPAAPRPQQTAPSASVPGSSVARPQPQPPGGEKRIWIWLIVQPGPAPTDDQQYIRQIMTTLQLDGRTVLSQLATISPGQIIPAGAAAAGVDANAAATVLVHYAARKGTPIDSARDEIGSLPFMDRDGRRGWLAYARRSGA